MLSMCKRCNIQCAALGQHLRAMQLQIDIKHLSPLPAGRSCLLSQFWDTPQSISAQDACIDSVLAGIAFLHKLSEAPRLCSALRSAHTTAFTRCGMSQRNPGCGTAASLLIISNTVSCLCERALV